MSACVCDWDPPSVYRRDRRTAATSHRCAECAGTIAPGERYEHAWGVWDGTADGFDTCPRCLALRDWVEAHVPCVCWEHGNMRDACLAEAHESGLDAPGLLFGAYRREIAIRRHAGASHA